MRTSHARPMWPTILGSVMLVCVLVVGVFAAAGLDDAISLYEEARYAEALEVLNRLAELDAAAPSSDVRRIAEYRALCLLALDRTEEARGVVRKLIEAQPDYQPRSAQFPPRFVTVVQETRVATLPDRVRTEYRQGKARYDEKSYRLAEEHFRKVVALLDDDSLPQAVLAPLADLRDLAEGFLSLIPQPPVAPLPAVAESLPMPPPAGVATRPRAFYTGADAGVRPPVVVKQHLPPWRTGFEDRRRFATSGALELIVDESGRVASARITSPMDPLYDAMLLTAARGWQYQPALKDGRPVKYRKVIAIRVTQPGQQQVP